MKKLILMRGLPASGKSTLAEQLIAKHGYGETVRINKDLLRTMLHFDRFSGKAEKATVKASIALTEMYLNQGMNVIIDDTNLNPSTIKMYEDIGARLGAKVEIVDIDIPVGMCISRDLTRDKKVGADVIRKMALQYKDYLKGEKFVLCDLDGTLCNIEHRLKYAHGEEKNWDKFFAGVPDDILRTEVLEQVGKAVADSEARVILVSARPERCRADTEAWLEENGVDGHLMLFMRANHDKRDDTVVKREMYDKYLKHLDIVKIFDDRPRVIAMWRELGLEVVDVGKGIDF